MRGGGLDLLSAATSLRDAGVQLLQYRDKELAESELFKNAVAIRSIFEGSKATLILNDWPEMSVAAKWHGVHVGQSDLSVSEARRFVGDERLVGISTHTSEQFCAALETDADYIAFGPTFLTLTKQDAESPVGLNALQAVRRLSERPLVAIGGISLGTLESVFAAGADSVAVIGALFQREQSVVHASSNLLQTAELSR